MAKDFASARSAKTFIEVGKASAEKANVITIKMVADEDLLDYPKNLEDISDTSDLENSVREIGFTDPVEITNYNMPDGKFMILSGHRRRAAGRACGITAFPCIVKYFNSAEAVHNYVLLANSQRDSSKDPVLYCKRYKMHEEYLRTIGFEGSIREEIAKRLGISIQQADRYNTMSKVILPVWNMVRDETVGMSSVLPLASHSVEEQFEIYEILKSCSEAGGSLTRETVKVIIDRYRDGGKDQTDKKTDKNREIKSTRHIIKVLEKLNLNNVYAFESNEEAENMLRLLASTFANMVDKMYNISQEYDIFSALTNALKDVEKCVKEYKKIIKQIES